MKRYFNRIRAARAAMRAVDAEIAAEDERRRRAGEPFVEDSRYRRITERAELASARLRAAWLGRDADGLIAESAVERTQPFAAVDYPESWRALRQAEAHPQRAVEHGGQLEDAQPQPVENNSVAASVARRSGGVVDPHAVEAERVVNELDTTLAADPDTAAQLRELDELHTLAGAVEADVAADKYYEDLHALADDMNEAEAREIVTDTMRHDVHVQFCQLDDGQCPTCEYGYDHTPLYTPSPVAAAKLKLAQLDQAANSMSQTEARDVLALADELNEHLDTCETDIEQCPTCSPEADGSREEFWRRQVPAAERKLEPDHTGEISRLDLLREEEQAARQALTPGYDDAAEARVNAVSLARQAEELRIADEAGQDATVERLRQEERDAQDALDYLHNDPARPLPGTPEYREECWAEAFEQAEARLAEAVRDREAAERAVAAPASPEVTETSEFDRVLADIDEVLTDAQPAETQPIEPADARASRQALAQAGDRAGELDRLWLAEHRAAAHLRHMEICSWEYGWYYTPEEREQAEREALVTRQTRQAAFPDARRPAEEFQDWWSQVGRRANDAGIDAEQPAAQAGAGGGWGETFDRLTQARDSGAPLAEVERQAGAELDRLTNNEPGEHASQTDGHEPGAAPLPWLHVHEPHSELSAAERAESTTLLDPPEFDQLHDTATPAQSTEHARADARERDAGEQVLWPGADGTQILAKHRIVRDQVVTEYCDPDGFVIGESTRPLAQGESAESVRDHFIDSLPEQATRPRFGPSITPEHKAALDRHHPNDPEVTRERAARVREQARAASPELAQLWDRATNDDRVSMADWSQAETSAINAAGAAAERETTREQANYDSGCGQAVANARDAVDRLRRQPAARDGADADQVGNQALDARAGHDAGCIDGPRLDDGDGVS